MASHYERIVEPETLPYEKPCPYCTCSCVYPFHLPFSDGVLIRCGRFGGSRLSPISRGCVGTTQCYKGPVLTGPEGTQSKVAFLYSLINKSGQRVTNQHQYGKTISPICCETLYDHFVNSKFSYVMPCKIVKALCSKMTVLCNAFPQKITLSLTIYILTHYP